MAIGIAGYGKIARDQHQPAIAASRDLELMAIADPTASHDTLPSYGDVSAMLAAHPAIAAVAICTPPAFRAAAARQAIQAGKHVLLEKPPCASVAEARELEMLARRAGVTLFTAWHSQKGAAVAPARAWLQGRTVEQVRVNWKEDVRVWHPGQAWIWQKGGFGVFDPGINALSILTTILPGTLQVTDADLDVPANCETPVAARLTLAGNGFAVEADLDFLQTGPQSWDIEVDTPGGRLLLVHGGNSLQIEGETKSVGAESEYAALYAQFVALMRVNACNVDLAPLQLVEDALRLARITTVPPFEEYA